MSLLIQLERIRSHQGERSDVLGPEGALPKIPHSSSEPVDSVAYYTPSHAEESTIHSDPLYSFDPMERVGRISPLLLGGGGITRMGR